MKIFSSKRSRRSLGALGVVAFVVSLIAGTTMVSAAGANTLEILDDGDGFVNVVEISNVTAGGGTDLAVVDVTIQFFADATCSGLVFTAPETVPASGSYASSQTDLSSFPDGPLCARADFSDGTSIIDSEIDTSLIDTTPPTINATIQDGGNGINAVEAAAGVDVDYTSPDAFSLVDIKVYNTGYPETANCAALAMPVAPSTYTITPACFGELSNGAVDVELAAFDAADNLGSTTVSTTYARVPLNLSAEILDGADFPATGQYDVKANAADTDNGTKLDVVLDIDSAAIGIVTATVTATDSLGVVTSTVKEMESISDAETRTVTLDISDLSQGNLVIDASIIDEMGGTSEAQATTQLDIDAPVTNFTAPADGDEFITLGIPGFFLLFGRNVDFKGATSDNLNKVQFVYLRGKNLDTGGTFGQHGTMSSRDSSAVTWSKTQELTPGEWEITACSQDRAGNLETNCPTITVFMTGATN